jgi:hypothetical protein
MKAWHAGLLLTACGAAPVVEAPMPAAEPGQGSYVWTKPRHVPEALAPAPGGAAATPPPAAPDKPEPAEENSPAAADDPPAGDEKSGVDVDSDDG